MARTSAKKIREDLENIRYYQWQFLRRNKKYQSDFDKLCKLTRKKHFDQSVLLEKLRTKAGKLQYEFEGRWSITHPADYREEKPYPFPALIAYAYPPVFSGCTQAFDTIKKNGTVVKVPRIITVSVNLDYSPGKIKTVFEDCVNREWKNRRKKLREVGVTKKVHQAQINSIPKKNKNMYDEYLKVWDFNKKHKRKTWKWKAKNLYRKGTVSEHRLFERYKTCERLVDGGYLDIK